MAGHYPAGTLTVKGADFEIWTDDSGTWYAMVRGAKVDAPTRDDLSKVIGRQIRAAATTVAVPFLARTGTRDAVVRAGTATGIHAGNRSILATWDATGEKAQLSRFGSDKYLGGTADAAEWQRLANAYLEASRAVHAYEEAHKIDLAATVQAALRAAIAGDEDGGAGQ